MVYAGAMGWLLGVWISLWRDVGPAALGAVGLSAAWAWSGYRSRPQGRAAAVFLAVLLLGLMRGDLSADRQHQPVPGLRLTVAGYVAEARAGGVYVLEVARPYRGRALVYGAPGSKLQYGDEVEVGGVPSDPAGLAARHRTAARSAGTRVVFLQPSIQVLGSEGGTAVGRGLWSLRWSISRMLEKHIPWPYAALGEGLLLGGSTALDPELRADFRDAGLSHLLAASGYNVTLIALFVFAVLGPLVGRRRALPACLLTIGLYVGLAGLSASVVRAGLMSAVALLGIGLGRQYDAGRSLAAAAVLLSAWQPETVLDIGAQLSFAATAGLIWLCPPVQSSLGRLPGAVSGLIAVTVCAQLVTLPIALYHFSSLSPWAVPANAAAAPLVPVGMAACALTLLGGAMGYAPGQLAGTAAGYVLSALSGVAQMFASMPGSGARTGQIGWWVVWGYYLVLLAAMLLSYRRRAAAPSPVQLP